jgi:hypothetical protein
MENNKNTDNEEINFYRKLLIDTSHISYGWMKTQKIIVISLSIVIMSLFIVFGIVCESYLRLAYAPEGYQKANTNTNINLNKNEK